jgi:hypothetical protein
MNGFNVHYLNPTRPKRVSVRKESTKPIVLDRQAVFPFLEEPRTCEPEPSLRHPKGRQRPACAFRPLSLDRGVQLDAGPPSVQVARPTAIKSWVRPPCKLVRFDTGAHRVAVQTSLRAPTLKGGLGLPFEEAGACCS